MLTLPRTLLVALAASTPALSQAKVNEDAEPNDLNGFPTTMVCGDQASGTIDPPIGMVIDEDAYTFLITGSQDIYAFTARGGETGFCSDTILELYAADGVTLLASDDNGGPGLYSALGPLTLPAGTYHLNVKQASLASSPGTYTLDLVCLPASTPSTPLCMFPPTAVSEVSEPNQSPLTATPTLCCSRNSGTIGFVGDVDWFCLLVNQELIVNFETVFCNGTLGDSHLWLWNSAGTQILYKDSDSGAGSLSKLEVRLQPSTYYIQVGGENGDTGTYCLDIDCAIPGNAPYGDPVFGTTGGGCQGTNGRIPTIVPRLGELPRLGSLFTVTCTDLPDPSVFTWAIVGFIDFSIDLTPFGATGCTLLTDTPVVFSGVPTVAGEAEICIPVTTDPFSVGLEFNVQFVAADPGANPLGAVFSNLGEGRVGI